MIVSIETLEFVQHYRSHIRDKLLLSLVDLLVRANPKMGHGFPLNCRSPEDFISLFNLTLFFVSY
jgi:hypothetical protein